MNFTEVVLQFREHIERVQDHAALGKTLEYYKTKDQINKAIDDKDEMFKKFFMLQLPEDAAKINDTESVQKEIKKCEEAWASKRASQDE